MKTFNLIRENKTVAEGVIFTDKTTVIRWVVPGMPNSTVVWASFHEAMQIHNHDENTLVRWTHVE